VTNVLEEAVRLARAGEPCALATVVAVVPPASAKRGDRGLVTADGALVGWVGGACSEPIVVREALRAIGEGTPRLVRIGPPGTAAGPDVVCAESHCASEGVVDVLIEPQLPAPLLFVAGEGPCAQTLAELARTIGWRVTRTADVSADACVIATMGRNDVEAVAAALAGSADYVALVASSRRATAVFELLREDGVP
jgi:xanthine dehydrogenase accessory factor